MATPWPSCKSCFLHATTAPPPSPRPSVGQRGPKPDLTTRCSLHQTKKHTSRVGAGCSAESTVKYHTAVQLCFAPRKRHSVSQSVNQGVSLVGTASRPACSVHSMQSAASHVVLKARVHSTVSSWYVTHISTEANDPMHHRPSTRTRAACHVPEAQNTYTIRLCSSVNSQNEPLPSRSVFGYFSLSILLSPPSLSGIIPIRGARGA